MSKLQYNNPNNCKTGIYCISDSNGHEYYGSATTLRSRYNYHKSQLLNNKHFNKHLQNAYNKNSNNWVFKVIEEDISLKELKEKEQVYLDKHFGTEKCLNKNPNANQVTHTQEVRDKISNALKGRTAWNKGKTMPPDVQERLRKLRLGTKNTLEHVRNMSNGLKGNIPWNKGKTLTAEHKQKISLGASLARKKA